MQIYDFLNELIQKNKTNNRELIQFRYCSLLFSYSINHNSFPLEDKHCSINNTNVNS